MKHSQLPWKIDEAEDLAFGIVTDNEDRFSICTMDPEARPYDQSKEVKANAELIVRACNSYDNFEALLDAAKILLTNAIDRGECHDEDTCDMFDDWRELVDAIDKCERR